MDEKWESEDKESSLEESKIEDFEESKIHNLEESIAEINPIKAHQDFVKVAPKINTGGIEKLNTLRIQKIRQIMSDEYKIQGVKLFDLHLLNMKSSKTKYLQHKDIIEIALIFCFFDSQMIFELCRLIYSWTEEKPSKYSYRFPLSVYKLMLFYEELEGFQLLYKREKIVSNQQRIISECFSYSLIICNPLLAVYLRNKYPEQLFHHKDIAIDAILHYLNEFTELNGGARYRRVKHLEQYLFLIERMLSFFSYSQGKYLINIFDKLIEMGSINISKILKKSSLPTTQKHDQIDKYENNFITYSLSPIKDCILIMYLCRKLETIHPEIKHIDIKIITKYSKIVSKIIDATDSIKEVYLMLTEKVFNKKEVIDIISSCDLQLILNNVKVARVVMDFWNGPFENEFFMNSSMAYQQVYSMLIDDKKFLDYKPESQYLYSISILFNKERRQCFQGVQNMMKMKKAHFFHFERWDKSLVTKYFIEAVFILFSCFISFSLITGALEFERQAQPVKTEITSLETSLNSTTDIALRSSIQATLDTKYAEAEELSKLVYHGFNDSIWVNWILCIYLLKNIKQYLFVKLRYKDTNVLVMETILSLIFCIALLGLSIAFYAYYSEMYDCDTDQYYYYKTMKQIEEDEGYIGINVIFAIILVVHSIRVLFILKASKTFGPMIEIIMNMLREVCIFGVIQASIIFIFFICMRILFFGIEQFKNETNTILTLFSASLANFDFRIFDHPDMHLNPWFGYLMMILFLGISSITLLNFLIAIISNVYDILNKIGIGLYLRTLISIRQVFQHDQKFSSLVSSVPPFNFFIFFFSPFILWFESSRLNSFLLHFEYICVLVISVTLYFFSCVVLIPIAYLVILVNLVRDFFGMKVGVDRSKVVVFVDFVVFLVFGVFVLLVQTWMDVVKFSGDLYNTNLIVKYDVESSVGRGRRGVIEDIDPRFYHLFNAFLQQYPVKKVSSKRLIKDLGEVLDVHSQIRTIIFQKQEPRETRKRARDHANSFSNKILQDHDEAYERLREYLLSQCPPNWILKQYNILKRLINQCSIPNKIRKNAGQFLNNIKIIEEDPIFSRQLSRKKSEVHNNIDFPFGAFTDTIFYVNEFLDMMKEYQEKAVFREMIYTNTFEESKIHLFTKSGFYKNKRLMKYSDKINLDLLRLQHKVFVPTKQQLQCIRVRRNYECLNMKS